MLITPMVCTIMMGRTIIISLMVKNIIMRLTQQGSRTTTRQIADVAPRAVLRQRTFMTKTAVTRTYQDRNNWLVTSPGGTLSHWHCPSAFVLARARCLSLYLRLLKAPSGPEFWLLLPWLLVQQ